MTIYVSTRAFYPPSCGGAGIYTVRLVNALSQSCRVVAGVTSYGACGIGDQLCPSVEQIQLTGSFPPAVADAEISWIAKNRPDWCVFSYPGSSDRYDLPRNTRIATIIYDLQQVVYPQNFSAHERWARDRAIRQAVDAADLLVTISEFSASEIIRFYPGSKERICVIYAGGEIHALTEGRLDEPYLLYPANFWPHKNHKPLLDAFRILRTEFPSLKLVLTGGDPSFAVPAVQRRLSDPGVILKGYVPPSELGSLLRNAECVVYPSLYEGFGMPVLEALQVGTPVACSRGTSLPEVGGAAAEYFSPDDASDIAEGVRRAVSNRHKPGWAKIAADQAMAFSFERTAQRLLKGMSRPSSGPSGRESRTFPLSQFWSLYPCLDAILLPVGLSPSTQPQSGDFSALTLCDALRLNPAGLARYFEKPEEVFEWDPLATLSPRVYSRLLSHVKSGRVVIFPRGVALDTSRIARSLAWRAALSQWISVGRISREAIRGCVSGVWRR